MCGSCVHKYRVITYFSHALTCSEMNTVHFGAACFDHVSFPENRLKSDGRELCQKHVVFLVALLGIF